MLPEVINFTRFFVNELKIKNIPWLLNVLNNYYSTMSSEWTTSVQTLPRDNGAELEMDKVLDQILDVMNN